MKKSEYIETLSEPINQLLADAKMRLETSYKEDKDKYQLHLLSSLDMLFSACVEKQQSGQKSSVRYLCFHNLYASIETGIYEYKIALYDKNLYLDRNETAIYWFPVYYNPIIEKDMEALKVLLQKNFIRVRDFDIKLMQKYYIKRLLDFTPEDIWDIKEMLSEIPTYEAMQKEKEFSTYVGEFMGTVTELW